MENTLKKEGGRHRGGMVVFQKMVPILENGIYQSRKMSRIKLKGLSYSVIRKYPQDGGREAQRGNGRFSKNGVDS